MDGSQRFEYDVYETDDSSGDGESSDEEEGYEKQFVINQGMMYMTSCNINQNIIPLVLQGKLTQGTPNTSGTCVCHVGSETNPGTINLNGVYDIYCDFISFTSASSSHKLMIGNILVINIDGLNCNNYNDSLSSTGKGLIQCPTKLLIPIDNSNNTTDGEDNYNTINTDTLYITSILPTKISKLTLTFTMALLHAGPVAFNNDDTFILKLIFKKTENSHMSSLLNKQQKTKTLF
jgi:hypothetical protein